MLRFSHSSRVVVVALLLSGTAQAQNLNQLLDLGQKALDAQQGQSRLLPQASPQQSPNNARLGAGLSQGDIGSGLKEALRLGADHVVSRLGRTDGFNSDPIAHIPLPGPLKQAKGALALAGQLGLTDDLEVRLNRAAEAATPPARKIFVDSISAMTVNDARSILTGPQNAATDYFRRTMTPGLKTAMRPIIASSLQNVGALQALSNVTQALPLPGSPQEMITDYVLDAALNGIFHYIEVEEGQIRTNPAKEGSALLRKVFGG